MSDINIELSTRAYCKMIMHSAKYPSSRLSGLLLARREDMTGGGRKMRVVDSIPLFHMNDGLTPMIEVALSQVKLSISLESRHFSFRIAILLFS